MITSFLKSTLAILLCAVLAFGACAVDSQEASNAGSRGTTSGVAATWNFNNVAGTKMLCNFIPSSSTGGSSAITAASYNSAALTAVGSLVTWDGGNSATRIYYLDSPATGTHTLSVTATGSGTFSIIGGCITFTGLNTGVGTATSGTQAGGTSASATAITTASGNCIYAGGGWGSGTGGTAGTGFTRTWLKNGSGSTGGDNGIGEYKISTGGATTPVINWTGSDVGGIQAVELIASGGGSTNFPRSASDTAVSSEVVARLLAALRTAANTTLSSEAVARSWGPKRTAADTTLSVESVVRSWGAVRNPSDLTLSETMNRFTVYGRVASDLSVSESLVGMRAINRTASDLSLTVSLARGNGDIYHRSAANATLSLESLTKSPLTLSRLANDGTLSEAINRGIGFTRSTSDGTLTVVITRSKGPVRIMTDGTLTVSVARQGVFLRSPSDTGFVSVIVLNGRALSANLSVGTLSSETITRSGVFLRSATDGTFSEAALRSPLGLSRLASDLSLSESIARVSHLNRSNNDGTMAESLVRFATFSRFATDGTLSVSESIRRNLFRLPSDSTIVSFSLTAIKSGSSGNHFTRSASDSTFLSEVGVSTHAPWNPVILSGHLSIYPYTQKVVEYKGFIHIGTYDKPVTIVVVTK